MNQENFGFLKCIILFKSFYKNTFLEFIRKDLFQIKTFAKKGDFKLNNLSLDM